MKILDKAILATITYYDTLGLPLTSFEIWKYLINPKHLNREDLSNISFKEVKERLKEKELSDYISESNGYWFLNSRGKDFYRNRIDTMKVQDQKRKKYSWKIGLLKYLPFIRAVFLSGSMAVGNPKERSDIDIFIIVKKGRIWLARFIVAFVTTILGIKRTETRTRDQLCLNHFIADSNLEVEHYSLYNAQVYSHFFLLFQHGNIGKNFLEENSWIKDYICGFDRFEFRDNNYSPPFLKKVFEFIFSSIIGDMCECILKLFQKLKIENNPKTHEEGGRVIATDNQLEFHPRSPEKDVIKSYNDKISSFSFMEEFSGETDSGLN